MFTAQPFLDLIRDRPDDIAPRRVWADWLEERGDTAYARTIRLACDCFEKPTWWKEPEGWWFHERPHPTILGRATWEFQQQMALRHGSPLPAWIVAGDCVERRDRTLWRILSLDDPGGFPGGQASMTVERVELSTDSLTTPTERAQLWQKLQTHLKGRQVYADLGIPIGSGGGQFILDRFYGLHTLQCSWAYWTRHADAILAAHPLRDVQLTTWPRENGLETVWRNQHGTCIRIGERQMVLKDRHEKPNDPLAGWLEAFWPQVKTWQFPPLIDARWNDAPRDIRADLQAVRERMMQQVGWPVEVPSASHPPTPPSGRR